MADDNIAIIQRVYDAMKSHDAGVMEDLFAEDITIRQSPEVPWGGEYDGKDGAFTFYWSSTSSRR